MNHPRRKINFVESRKSSWGGIFHPGPDTPSRPRFSREPALCFSWGGGTKARAPGSVRRVARRLTQDELLRRFLHYRSRLVIVNGARSFMRQGFSQTQAAYLSGVAPSTLCRLLNQNERQ